jgi:hypothetical protein
MREAEAPRMPSERLHTNDPSSGYTDSLKGAKREFAAAWRAWLAKTGRDEETYRPRYGRPVEHS